ncbi:MAG: tetratricopeptide repeat protein, partial [Desulfomonilaceae bacterium]
EEKKDLVKATELYKKAIAAEPSFKEAYYRLGLIYAQREEYATALDMMNKIREIDKDDPAARFHAGALLLKLGRVQEGLKLLNTLAKQEPESQWGKDALAQIDLVNKPTSQMHSGK